MAHITDSILITFITLSLPYMRCEAQSTVHHNISRYEPICRDGFMSVHIPKEKFADLPFTIYVQDEHSGYYQAIAVATQCHYLLIEAETFFNLTVASHGCFVRRQKYLTSLTVVIMKHAEKGRLEIVKTIHVTCERKIKEMAKYQYPLLSRNLFCSKDGFKITISQNATVPPLNLDAVWIPSSKSANCKPQKRSKEDVTFSFLFTDCGTQSMAENGIITYWVNIEVKQHPQKSPVFRNTPFNLTVHCSFMLGQTVRLGFNIQQKRQQDLFILRSEGMLRADMRFAKDSNYRSFYSSHDPPVVKLGLPVYVEVFVLKHEDRDLVLVLEDCWATPTPNPQDTQRWDLLVKGCPFSGDSHKTNVLPVVSSKEIKFPHLHKWMAVKLFSFVESQSTENLIYFHCDIKICKGKECSQSCNNERRTSRWITPRLGQKLLHSVVSGGPLFLSTVKCLLTTS
ncbi:zona pellucida sperm-binding protein 4-like isoform X1 [Xyrichtys novacula]|uniref:Zona pellucida sperm-binding protein 4-like isoform X1 n=1 Tax=Xyrichtys novacula TaxID=13765 RepID=A0AAV1FY35_XYRNO|nr:zona pellucida sperm-binding protein 4-like isoform X1 [Xyrichtys novacula]